MPTIGHRPPIAAWWALPALHKNAKITPYFVIPAQAGIHPIDVNR
jgi:hypothetical protein